MFHFHETGEFFHHRCWNGDLNYNLVGKSLNLTFFSSTTYVGSCLPAENTEWSRVCFSLDISILEQCHLRDLCLCKHSAYFLYVQISPLPTETSVWTACEACVTVLCFIELVHANIIQPSGTHLMHSKEQPVPQQLEKPETEMRCWAVMADKSEIKSASKSSLIWSF